MSERACAFDPAGIVAALAPTAMTARDPLPRILPTPHDALFRAVFERVEAVRGECRAVLPAAVLERLHLGRVTTVPGHFVDAALRTTESDALFRVGTRTRETFVYVLLEHQSRDDATMPLRLLRYMTSIWERMLAEDATRPLSPIIPIVISNVPGGWKGPRSFRDLFEETGGFDQFVPRFDFIVDDLYELDVEALKRREVSPFARLALWVMRTARDEARLLRENETFRRELHALALAAPRDSARLLVYLESVSPQAFQVVVDGLNTSRQEHERMITAMDIWRAGRREEYLALMEKGLKRGLEKGIEKGLEKGLQRGRKEGFKEGHAEGLVEGERQALLRLIELRFGHIERSLWARITQAAHDDREKLIRALAVAEKPEQLVPARKPARRSRKRA